MTTIVTFDASRQGLTLSDVQPTELVKWQKLMLLQAAENLLYRQAHGERLNSVELGWLKEIKEFWPTNFEEAA